MTIPNFTLNRKVAVGILIFLFLLFIALGLFYKVKYPKSHKSVIEGGVAAITDIVTVEGSKPNKTGESIARQYRDHRRLISGAVSSKPKSDDVSGKITCPIFYINLERSPERNEYMKKEFAKYNLSSLAHRVEAVDGKILSLSNSMSQGSLPKDPTIKFVNSTKITFSELGCTLSHLYSIYSAYIANFERALIVEDDASFCLIPLWCHTLDEICQQAPDDWEILHLFQFHDTIDPLKPFELYKDSYGAVSYLVNRKGMEKILDACFVQDPVQGGTFHLTGDAGVSDVLIYKACKTYSYKIPLFIADNDDSAMASTIHNDHMIDHTDRMVELMEYYTKPASFYCPQPNFWGHNTMKTLFPGIRAVITPDSYMVRFNQALHIDPKCVACVQTCDIYQNVVTHIADAKAKGMFVILFDAEPHDLSMLTGPDLIITTKNDPLLLPSTIKSVYVPYWRLALSEAGTSISDLLVHDFQTKPSQQQPKPKKWAAFMYSNCETVYEGVRFRKQFLDRLQARCLDNKSKYDALGKRVEVDVLGKCYNDNFGKKEESTGPGSHLNAKEIYYDYKFVISMENSFVDGYITEKLTNPLLSVNSYRNRSIPVYLGSATDLTSCFDTNRMVHVRDYLPASKTTNAVLPLTTTKVFQLGNGKSKASTLEFLSDAERADLIDRVIDRMFEIEDDDTLYSQIVNSNVFLDNQIPDKFHWGSIYQQLTPYLPVFLSPTFFT